MVSRGPRAVEVVLSAEERAELSRWAGGAVSARVAERARIILACAEGASNTGVASDFGVSTETVRKWRSRFAGQRMAGLVDEPRPGRRKPELVLSEAERAELTRWARRAKTAQFLALRARIVLRCAQGGTNKEIAAELGVSHGTVNRWRSRFIRLRLDGLTDEARPGRPPSILLDQVEDVVVATLESTPGKDTHWSRASMAKHSAVEVHHRADLEEVRPQAAPAGRVQAVHRPAVHREGRRRRGPVPPSAREGGGAVRG